MLRVMLIGTLLATPVVRQTVKDKPFVTFSLKEDGGVIASCIAFDTDIVNELVPLKKGASLAVRGKGELRTWTGKDGVEHYGVGITVEQAMQLETSVKKATKDKPKPAAKPEPEAMPLQPWPAGTTVNNIPSDTPF